MKSWKKILLGSFIGFSSMFGLRNNFEPVSTPESVESLRQPDTTGVIVAYGTPDSVDTQTNLRFWTDFKDLADDACL